MHDGPVSKRHPECGTELAHSLPTAFNDCRNQRVKRIYDFLSPFESFLFPSLLITTITQVNPAGSLCLFLSFLDSSPNLGFLTSHSTRYNLLLNFSRHLAWRISLLFATTHCLTSTCLVSSHPSWHCPPLLLVCPPAPWSTGPLLETASLSSPMALIQTPQSVVFPSTMPTAVHILWTLPRSTSLAATSSSVSRTVAPKERKKEKRRNAGYQLTLTFPSAKDTTDSTTWLANPKVGGDAFTNVTYYVPNPSGPTGFVTSNTTATDIITSGFTFYGTLAMLKLDSKLYTLWYAVPTGIDGVWSVGWNATSDQTDAELLTVKAVNPPNVPFTKRDAGLRLML